MPRGGRHIAPVDESDVQLRGGDPVRPAQDDELPWGGRGTIAGPLTVYVSPVKSM
ncbi:hypothetical protein [Streptomyces bungoensis]|uniref:hypothetical protein n=1 Tax=Streptomyces bungoensis TaxID=285568 RepID=UPI003F551BFA